jgi:hypothetical protein
MKLKQAFASRKLCDDVKRYAAFPRTSAGMATYRALGACPCGTPVPIHVVAVWSGKEPSILTASVCGESCPDCEGKLTPQEVIYVGISSPGYPALPATGFSVNEVMLTDNLEEPDGA